MKRILFISFLTAVILWPGSVRSENADSAYAPPVVRVLIAQDQKSMSVTVKGEFVVREWPSLKILKEGSGLDGAVLSAAPRGFKLGADEWRAPALRIEAKTPRDLYLNRKRFRGAVDIHRTEDGRLDAVNHLDLESYLYGVLHHEVAPWWPMEALKAQAVAARTYALYQTRVRARQRYDLESGTASQVYGGSTTERYRTKRAVDLTAGQVLTFGGKVFPAFFHATCGGRIAGAQELWNIDIPPLRGGQACGYCWFSPHFRWHSRIPLADIEETLKKNDRPVGRILSIRPLSRTPSERVGRLKITGTGGEAVVAAKDFRIWMGGDRFRSTAFSVRVRDDAAEFQGRGWGHGVGLCQWGAFGQSLVGRSYEDILRFYYPGASVARITPAMEAVANS